MPDKRKHRGRHPRDEQLFASGWHDTLRSAVDDSAWLLSRRYAESATLKLVGDHYSLTSRQRMAVRRSTCSDESLRRRRAATLPMDQIGARPLGIDGYNLLITIESALAGGLILLGRDGCCRDLAGIHGTYRKVSETAPAVQRIVDELYRFNVSRVDWYLDRPVSNSGRLKMLMADILAAGNARPDPQTVWNIELVESPDAVLIDYGGVVATSDSVILDRCRAWVNLAREMIDARIPNAWIVDLSRTAR